MMPRGETFLPEIVIDAAAGIAPWRDREIDQVAAGMLVKWTEHPRRYRERVMQIPRIPTLTTERLVLRPMSSDDWPPYSMFMASQRARHMGGPFSTKIAWGMFCADHAQWMLFGVGGLMMEERASGRCIGQVGINSGPLFPKHELGWLVFPEFEGQSYAFEAASILRDWAKGIKRLPTLVSYVDPDNLRSRSLAERLGATLDDGAPRQDSTDLVYRHFG